MICFDQQNIVAVKCGKRDDMLVLTLPSRDLAHFCSLSLRDIIKIHAKVQEKELKGIIENRKKNETMYFPCFYFPPTFVNILVS